MRNLRDAYKKAHLVWEDENAFQLKKHLQAVQDDLDATKVIVSELAALATATVTFDSDGGSSVASQTVPYNTVATEPEDPTKEHNTFSGWFEGESTEEFVFTTKIRKNTTLTAHWTLVNHTVTFNSDGGSDVPSQSVPYGTTATEPEDPTKEGKVFGGWFNGEAETAFDFATPITTDITLTAHWS